MSILLKDTSGNIWSVGATSGGNLTTTPASGSPIPTKLFLRNSGLVWQVKVLTSGLLTTTLAAITDTPQYAFIDIGSTPDWSMSVNSIGLLQTSKNGLSTTWVPNGGGCSTDNSVVGGGGGFMSYPQPPTGPNAAFFPPDRNGQFGPIQINFNNGIGTYFQVFNPGRSANQ